MLFHVYRAWSESGEFSHMLVHPLRAKVEVFLFASSRSMIWGQVPSICYFSTPSLRGYQKDVCTSQWVDAGSVFIEDGMKAKWWWWWWLRGGLVERKGSRTHACCSGAGVSLPVGRQIRQCKHIIEVEMKFINYRDHFHTQHFFSRRETESNILKTQFPSYENNSFVYDLTRLIVY